MHSYTVCGPETQSEFRHRAFECADGNEVLTFDMSLIVEGNDLAKRRERKAVSVEMQIEMIHPARDAFFIVGQLPTGDQISIRFEETGAIVVTTVKLVN